MSIGTATNFKIADCLINGRSNQRVAKRPGPEWLPVGATAFADFVNDRYYAGGQVIALSDMLTSITPVTDAGYAADAGDASGAENEILGAFATTLKTLNWTIVLDLHLENNDNGALAILGIKNLDDTLSFTLGRLNDQPELLDNSFYVQDSSEDVTRDPAPRLFVSGIPIDVKCAVTRTYSKIVQSVNGSSILLDATSFTGDAVATHAYFNMVFPGSFLLKTFTVYPPQPDAALPALSTVS